VWLEKKNNKNKKTKHVAGACKSKAYVFYDDNFLNVGAWDRPHCLRLTCPPPNPLGYCVKLILKKIYQSYQN
jgi:hypothetical protein